VAVVGRTYAGAPVRRKAMALGFQALTGRDYQSKDKMV